MLLLNLVIYAIAFFILWVGSGLIVSAASKFSSKLKLSPFAFSFVFLGILTSIPEFSVGIQSVADKDPAIFVGNLLGGVIVLFLVVIPLLAVFGNGINLKNELSPNMLVVTAFVITLPSLLILDRSITIEEGVVMVGAYGVLLYLIQRKNGIFDRKNEKLLDISAYSYKDLLKILSGVGLVFIASNLVVDKTLFFGELLNIPVFYIGLLVVALGTDLPELTLAIRSVISGNKELAIGDYIGAAAVSTLFFGIFTILSRGEVITESNFLLPFFFILLALSLFYVFMKDGKISRLEGALMLCFYFLFVAFEIVI